MGAESSGQDNSYGMSQPEIENQSSEETFKNVSENTSFRLPKSQSSEYETPHQDEPSAHVPSFGSSEDSSYPSMGGMSGGIADDNSYPSDGGMFGSAKAPEYP